MALTCNATDILVVLGALDRVVAVEEDCPVAEATSLARIRNDDRPGVAKGLNVEAVLGFAPDLVIAKGALRESLASVPVPVLWMPRTSGPTAVQDAVRAVAAAVSLVDRGEAVLARMEARCSELRALTAGRPRPRTYYEGIGLGRTAGRGSVVHAMIELAGGENVAGTLDDPAPVLGAEAILAADPEVIVLSPFADRVEEIVRRPGWARLSAVRSGRVHRVPLERRQVLLATPRCVEGCAELLVPWLHRDLVPLAEKR